ncbi:MAG: hypothetical protein OQK94_00525 [Gammaproteobacteria bacterium]|nr:hypothetical protein [Gammaproteobacteria bacterium]MCW8839959.1 hypothetical protein [Gammaproteobacteria bacterium]MCW8959324.1 hypothetical protein [Gammaproteobacteria bacterium]MCW8993771.1 hypothetical protein [Gammaproteobacteria bacterium]
MAGIRPGLLFYGVKKDVRTMVFKLFSSRYALRLCGLFAVALISGYSQSAAAISCSYGTESTTQYFDDQWQAQAACNDQTAAAQDSGCTVTIWCSLKTDYYNTVLNEQVTNMGISHKFSWAPPPLPDCTEYEGQTVSYYAVENESGGNYDSLDGCGGSFAPAEPANVFCDDYINGPCYVYGEFTFDGTDGSSSDDLEQTHPPEALPLPPETPTYSETQELVSNESETLPDGTVVETVVDQYTKEKTGTTSYEQGPNGQIIKITPDGERVVMTTTTTTTTSPDGSSTVQTTEQTDYVQPDSSVLNIDTTTNNTTNTTSVTNIYSTTIPGTSTSSTTETTQSTAPDGTVTGTSTTTTGDPDGTADAEDEVSSSGSIEGGEIETPDTSIGDSAKEYSESTKGHMDRIKASPIVSAATSAFNVSIPSGVCPSLALDLSPIMANVSTTVHCDLMDYINGTLYPLLLAMWGLAGVMIFLRA